MAACAVGLSAAYDIMKGEAVALARLLGYFLIVGLCEIGGGYRVWLWLCRGQSPWYAVAGGVALLSYGVIPTWQPAPFGRVYAAYGGITLALLGGGVMMDWPR